MIHFDFDYTGWERLQEKILRVPPRLGKKVSYGASKDAKTYLQSRIKYNRYNLLTAITGGKIDVIQTQNVKINDYKF